MPSKSSCDSKFCTHISKVIAKSELTLTALSRLVYFPQKSDGILCTHNFSMIAFCALTF